MAWCSAPVQANDAGLVLDVEMAGDRVADHCLKFFHGFGFRKDGLTESSSLKSPLWRFLNGENDFAGLAYCRSFIQYILTGREDTLQERKSGVQPCHRVAKLLNLLAEKPTGTCGRQAWRVNMFELAWKLLMGAVAGGIARYALPGRNPGGLVASVMVGLAGSFLAAYVGETFGWYRQDEIDGIIMCGVGAIVVLTIFRFLSGTTAGSAGRENYDL